MRAHDRRLRLRREFRPEPLEDRSLLSTVPAHHVVTARVTGQINQMPGLPGQLVFGNFAGNGNAHRFGTVTMIGELVAHVEDQYTGTTTIQQGGASLTSPALGQVDVAFTGSETIAGFNKGTITLTGGVVNATGRFAGDVGTFNATGTLATIPGQFSLYITLNLHRPRPAALRHA
jgi:hypothetical protein